MHIYRLLIMFGHVMDWALDWSADGHGPSRPQCLIIVGPRAWLVVF